jgi:two-component system, LytTR family, response regulator
VKLRVVVADDERPARTFLVSQLREFEDVAVVGEAATGAEAVALIERVGPDLALLDLQMPELDGLAVVGLLRRERMPLVAFVTAYDEYAVRAFEMNAVDYLLKPVELPRLRQTINRAVERLERAEMRADDAERIRAAATEIARSPATLLRRIPVRKREDIILVPVEQIVSIVANGELLDITTRGNERFTITYRLKDLEARLDPAEFVRLSRGTIVSVAAIRRVTPVPGGTYLLTLENGQEHQVSRQRARILRDQLLRL